MIAVTRAFRLGRPPCHSCLGIRSGSTIPPRSDRFTVPRKSHVDDLRNLLTGATSVQSTLDGSASANDLVGYNDDWMNKYHGKSPIVVKPRNTEEVSRVIKYCHENDIAIVPQSGNTGLVGEIGQRKLAICRKLLTKEADRYRYMTSWFCHYRTFPRSDHSTLSLASWCAMLELSWKRPTTTSLKKASSSR